MNRLTSRTGAAERPHRDRFSVFPPGRCSNRRLRNLRPPCCPPIPPSRTSATHNRLPSGPLISPLSHHPPIRLSAQERPPLPSPSSSCLTSKSMTIKARPLSTLPPPLARSLVHRPPRAPTPALRLASCTVVTMTTAPHRPSRCDHHHHCTVLMYYILSDASRSGRAHTIRPALAGSGTLRPIERSTTPRARDHTPCMPPAMCETCTICNDVIQCTLSLQLLCTSPRTAAGGSHAQRAHLGRRLRLPVGQRLHSVVHRAGGERGWAGHKNT